MQESRSMPSKFRQPLSRCTLPFRFRALIITSPGRPKQIKQKQRCCLEADGVASLLQKLHVRSGRLGLKG